MGPVYPHLQAKLDGIKLPAKDYRRGLFMSGEQVDIFVRTLEDDELTEFVHSLVEQCKMGQLAEALKLHRQLGSSWPIRICMVSSGLPTP